MSKLVIKIVIVALLALVLLGAGLYGWADVTSAEIRSRTIETHAATFPIPFPLTAEERAELGVDEAEAPEMALSRAIERGRHLVEARYGCTECHGASFSGGVMLDAVSMGTWRGPNLTLGEGSRTIGYTSSDWDRIVRHGVRPDGSPSVMPSQDFQLMTDQELSDIAAYIRSRPPMFGEVPPVTYGPIAKILMATGELLLPADQIGSHTDAHAVAPPVASVSDAFGRHLAGVCVGCHRESFQGGPIAGGALGWAPAGNLTPHEDGLEGWTYDDFLVAMTRGRRPDGSELREPMSLMLPYAQRMTTTEVRALWAYLSSLPPRETGS